MYTEEDFWRDYPPTPEPFMLPWQKEYHDRKVKEAAQQAAQAAREAAREAAKKALMEGKREGKMEGKREGEAKGKMKTAKVLLSMGMEVSLISKATDLSQEIILSLKEPTVA